MEICDINPRPVCKFETKLVPKLIPHEICFKIPREKCVLNFQPKEVKKTLETNWCRPLDPTELTSSGGSSDSKFSCSNMTFIMELSKSQQGFYAVFKKSGISCNCS